jgi:putative endonuclease
MSKTYYVYILSSKRNGTLYIGSTSNLVKRVWQHKKKAMKGFTEKYDVNMLVYFELTEDSNTMVVRERQLKKWKREWKIRLIEEKNPEWKDLFEEIL